jgi:hypothetical protein
MKTTPPSPSVTLSFLLVRLMAMGQPLEKSPSLAHSGRALGCMMRTPQAASRPSGMDCASCATGE